MSKIPKYKLYVNKMNSEIRLEKQRGNVLTVRDIFDTNAVLKFNDCYYLSDNRNALIDKALEIKNEWISEYKSKINQLMGVNYRKTKEFKEQKNDISRI